MDWRIERIRDRCFTCSKPFEHDQRVVSVVEADTEKVVRHDLCDGCAPKGGTTAVSLWWETRFQQQTNKKKKVDFNRLLRIFEAWQKAPPPGQESLVYLIALLLVRKRFLKMVDLVNEGGVECLRLRRPGLAEQWYMTPAPLLTAADLPALRAKLEELIDGSFEEEEMPASTDPSAAESAAG
jgi:hypothetical protein